MGEILNRQPTKELQYFQKLIVQDKYIKYLNKGLDYLGWENEKKEAIIEMKDKEIIELGKIIERQTTQISKSENEFKQYIKKVKEAKVDLNKQNQQQEIINDLRQRLQSTEQRLKVRDKMLQLMTRQNKHRNG